MAWRVAVQCVTPAHRPYDASRIRVEQDLVPIEAMTFFGPIRTVNAITVQESRPRLRQIAVPDPVRALGEREAFQLAATARIEDGQLDRGGMRRMQREVHTLAIPRRAERIGLAGPDDGGRRHARESPGASRWRARTARSAQARGP